MRKCTTEFVRNSTRFLLADAVYITRRADEITLDIEAQLKEDIASCQFYSLCLDESCDITDIAQLAVFIRMFFFRRLHKGRVSVFGALVVDNT